MAQPPTQTKRWSSRDFVRIDNYRGWDFNTYLPRDWTYTSSPIRWSTPYKVINSSSTKPWPAGGPSEWTPHLMWLETITANEGVYRRYETSPVPSKGTFLMAEKSGDYGACFNVQPSLPESASFQGWHSPSKATLDNKIRNKLKSDFNAAVALAEVQQSVDTVAKRLYQMRDAFASLRTHGNTARALKILGGARKRHLGPAQKDDLRRRVRNARERKFAQGVLETQYGWRPLLSDISAAIDVIKNVDKALRVRASVSSTDRRRIDRVTPGKTSAFRDRGLETSSGKLTYVIEYTIDDTYLQRLASVGVFDLGLVVWEKIPYSFVVDWLLPVGDALGSLTATMGLSFKRGVYVNLQKYSINLVTVGTKTGAAGEEGFGKMAYTQVRKKRTVITDFPTASFPRFKNPFSVEHAVNALALLTSSFVSKKK